MKLVFEIRKAGKLSKTHPATNNEVVYKNELKGEMQLMLISKKQDKWTSIQEYQPTLTRTSVIL